MATEILIVDDEADIRMLMAGLLQDEGFTTREAGDSDTALREIQARRPGLVILDIWLQNSALDGIEILKRVQQIDPDLPVVMISGHGNIETAVKAIKIGAYDFIEKPFDSDRMLLILNRALEAAKLRRENAELRLRAGPEEELIGQSNVVQGLRQTIGKVAPTGSRVLVTGPAGAGKEVVARCLHAQSRRADQPFVVINCASMHPDRLEEELFGVEGEGENGEGVTRVGTLERAHGGTLLLDEVADMPLETQGKIVRVLQDQTFQRLGGSRRVEVDVRIIASTNKSLSELIEEGRFREDLFYRLNVVPLAVPPLKDRREDIPLLADHFMRKAAEGAGLPERRFSEDALAALQSFEWPGNVRQLRNVAEWMLIAGGSENQYISAEMLPAEIGSRTPAILKSEGAAELMSLPLREAREMFERQYLEAQVIRFGGNISRTATFVGMERSALHRKLRSLGISSTTERQ
jgi:two-component system nitrogen regulation response regulator NtrX